MVEKYLEFEKLTDNFRYKLNGKRIFIWGYGAQGKLLEEYWNGISIEAVIDDNCPSLKGVYRHHILYKYDPSTSFVIIAVSGEAANTIKKQLDDMGFRDCYAVLRELFYGENETTADYFQWVQKDLNINFTGKEKEKVTVGNPYGIIYGTDVKKILANFVFQKTDAVFDFGCGRGAALSMFAHCGAETLGGIEYNKELCSSAIENLLKLKIKADIVNGDAAEYCDLDKYNYFYMYDPFSGELFEKVITNIEESYARKQREIILIYVSPREHKKVVMHDIFKFVKEIQTISGTTGTANIYVINEE